MSAPHPSPGGATQPLGISLRPQCSHCSAPEPRVRVVLGTTLWLPRVGTVPLPPVRPPCALGDCDVDEVNGPRISCSFPSTIAQGTEIWSSPQQPAAVVNLVTYPRLQLVVTADKQGLIKVWKAENGRERASFSLPTFSSALQACDHPEGPFLLVSDGLLGASAGPSCLLGSWILVL